MEASGEHQNRRPGAGGSLGDIHTFDAHFSGRRLFEADQRAEQGALAGAGAADHHHRLAVEDFVFGLCITAVGCA
jgi:hypothetical protein